MRIKTELGASGWRADCLDLPGMPPVGTGKTEQQALCALFYCMTFEKVGGGKNWWQYVKVGPIELNGIPWPYGQQFVDKRAEQQPEYDLLALGM